MALAHQSIATIDSPEFINLKPTDLNPLMSSCEIKVMYVGENRNQSFISKQVATEMSKTLRGAPIVGYYKQDKDDFTTHGDQLILDDEGFHFNSLTRPYGFVSPDAKVWFQKFDEKDDFGNPVTRDYLMTTGYLWTGQYPEANKVYEDGGKPHSMELDEDSLQGHWATNNKSGMEFFIINDAIFSKLCILGDDVEPCYEGSAVTPPDISKNFTKNVDSNFKHTLFTMMRDLQTVLKGEKDMADTNKNAQDPEEKKPETDFTASNPESAENTQGKNDSSPSSNFQNNTEGSEQPNTSFKKGDNEDGENAKGDKPEDNKDGEDPKDGNADNSGDKEDDEKKDGSKKYELLENEYNELKTQFEALKTQNEDLIKFKRDIENKEKDNLIAEFSMLSDEEKKDVIENKSKYTLDEIKSKLSVIYFDKQVKNSLNESAKNDNNKEKEVVTTFDVHTDGDASIPDWVKDVEAIQNKL